MTYRDLCGNVVSPFYSHCPAGAWASGGPVDTFDFDQVRTGTCRVIRRIRRIQDQIHMLSPQSVHPVAALATATRARMGRVLRKRFMIVGFGCGLRETSVVQMIVTWC